MYASFVTIGLATGIAVLTPYVLTTNLGIPQAAQGTALGTLAIAQELALLLGFALFGALADKFGRRVVYALGMVLLAVAYGAYAFGETMAELVVLPRALCLRDRRGDRHVRDDHLGLRGGE